MRTKTALNRLARAKQYAGMAKEEIDDKNLKERLGLAIQLINATFETIRIESGMSRNLAYKTYQHKR